ncbi:MAG: proteasome assembly chaperone family protein [Thermoplasmata archaeon]|nr:proteasome assembly chaperone family protein [Thermoplasmata archaeon]
MEGFRISEASVVFLKKPRLKEPILIEGLPGVGNVGKLAAEHLIDEIKAKKFAEVYSNDFPPQVLINDDGTIKLVRNELYYWKGKDKQLIILVGDYQGLSARGQYMLAQAILDIVEKYGTKMIFTLGGYGTGVEVEKPRVTGAATHIEIVKKLKKYGVNFKDEPGGGIIGASGLLLGLGMLRGMKGACLMGETAGYIVDPNSARQVLEVLTRYLGLDINFAKLEEKALEVKKITERIKKMEMAAEKSEKEDLRYIG